MPLISLLLVSFLFLTGYSNLFSFRPSSDAEDYAQTYGHISYVDKGATVIREDKTEAKAIVNLPVAPGDQIVTGDNGRCEIQFGNGTVLRLDKNSRLKITTILAPTLTSNYKVTTLHLMRGQLYTMNQRYNREMFQIITPNTAIDFKKRAAATVKLNENGDTFIFSEKGKFEVMFGENVKDLKTEKILPKKGYLVSSNHKISLVKDQRDVEFVGWNEYVNRNFKDLHFGVSKVPKKIYTYNKGLVYWAEKWSSLYGEWIYDDVFGYVWKPGDEIFSYSKRPFFHAQYVRVNKQLFLVPSEPWGWVPAHLGTWVWMKWGWTWVPGDAFHSGVGLFQTMFGSNMMYSGALDYWLYPMFGTRDLFWIYKHHGYNAWRSAYLNIYNRVPPKPKLKDAPDAVRFVLKKMLKAPANVLKEKLGTNHPTPEISRNQIEPLLNTRYGMGKLKLSKEGIATIVAPKPKTSKTTGIKTIKKGASLSDFGKRTGEMPVQIQPNISKKGVAKISKSAVKGFRDFNPDVRWGFKQGMKVNYSSETNAMVIPRLKVNSRTISNAMKRSMFSKRGRYNRRGQRSGGGAVSSTTGTASSTSTTAATASGSRSGGSVATKGGGVGTASEKK